MLELSDLAQEILVCGAFAVVIPTTVVFWLWKIARCGRIPRHVWERMAAEADARAWEAKWRE